MYSPDSRTVPFMRSGRGASSIIRRRINENRQTNINNVQARVQSQQQMLHPSVSYDASYRRQQNQRYHSPRNHHTMSPRYSNRNNGGDYSYQREVDFEGYHDNFHPRHLYRPHHRYTAYPYGDDHTYNDRSYGTHDDEMYVSSTPYNHPYQQGQEIMRTITFPPLHNTHISTPPNGHFDQSDGERRRNQEHYSSERLIPRYERQWKNSPTEHHHVHGSVSYEDIDDPSNSNNRTPTRANKRSHSSTRISHPRHVPDAYMQPNVSQFHKRRRPTEEHRSQDLHQGEDNRQTPPPESSSPPGTPRSQVVDASCTSTKEKVSDEISPGNESIKNKHVRARSDMEDAQLLATVCAIAHGEISKPEARKDVSHEMEDRIVESSKEVNSVIANKTPLKIITEERSEDSDNTSSENIVTPKSESTPSQHNSRNHDSDRGNEQKHGETHDKKSVESKQPEGKDNSPPMVSKSFSYESDIMISPAPFHSPMNHPSLSSKSSDMNHNNTKQYPQHRQHRRAHSLQYLLETPCCSFEQQQQHMPTSIGSFSIKSPGFSEYNTHEHHHHPSPQHYPHHNHQNYNISEMMSTPSSFTRPTHHYDRSPYFLTSSVSENRNNIIKSPPSYNKAPSLPLLPSCGNPSEEMCHDSRMVDYHREIQHPLSSNSNYHNLHNRRQEQDEYIIAPSSRRFVRHGDDREDHHRHNKYHHENDNVYHQCSPLPHQSDTNNSPFHYQPQEHGRRQFPHGRYYFNPSSPQILNREESYYNKSPSQDNQGKSLEESHQSLQQQKQQHDISPTNDSSKPIASPIKAVLRKKFTWKNYPELEKFLVDKREEYLHYSRLNYTVEQKKYNNKLTEKMLELAEKEGYVFDKEEFDFVTIRDRIRCKF